MTDPKKDAEEIVALADRLDPSQLWKLSQQEIEKLPQEDQDRLWAAVHLRRYADGRLLVARQTQVGREFIRGHKIELPNDFDTTRAGCGQHEWHRALNGRGIHDAAQHWMYTAKMVSYELSRMILLFELERTGRLADSFKMSGNDPRPATPVPDNHLRCAMGIACRDCPFLKRIDSSQTMTPEAKDEAKAWTCVTHILLNGTEEDYWESLINEKTAGMITRSMMRGG